MKFFTSYIVTDRAICRIEKLVETIRVQMLFSVIYKLESSSGASTNIILFIYRQIRKHMVDTSSSTSVTRGSVAQPQDAGVSVPVTPGTKHRSSNASGRPASVRAHKLCQRVQLCCPTLLCHQFPSSRITFSFNLSRFSGNIFVLRICNNS